MLKGAVDVLGVGAEVLMLYYLYEAILVSQPHFRWQKAIVYSAAGVALLIIAGYTPTANSRMIIYVAAIFVLLAAYQSNWKKCLLAGAVYIAGPAAVELAIKWGLFKLYGQTISLDRVFSETLAFFVLYGLLSLYHVCKQRLSWRLFLLRLILIPVSICALWLLASRYYPTNTPFVYLRLRAICLLLIGINVAIYYLFGRMAEMEEMRKREALAQIQLDLQQKQYAQLTVQQAEIRRMHHDMKRHLQMIGQYLSDGQFEQAMAYIHQQEVSIAKQRATVTGYSLLDGVLAIKKETAESGAIRWQCEAYLPSVSAHFPEADVAIILDNALDNALEASAPISDEEKRWIEIAIREREAFLYLTIRNGTEREAIIGRDKKLATTKADTRNHGLGLTTIHQLAQKHNGTMDYECDGEIFTLRVMLSLTHDGIGAPETALVPGT